MAGKRRTDAACKEFLAALKRCGGNQVATQKALRMARGTFFDTLRDAKARFPKLYTHPVDGRRDRVAPLSPADVAKMMVLLKMARSEQGDYNPDNHIDGAAYFSIAGELDGKRIK